MSWTYPSEQHPRFSMVWPTNILSTKNRWTPNMESIGSEQATTRQPRRTFTKQFKAQLVAQVDCRKMLWVQNYGQIPRTGSIIWWIQSMSEFVWILITYVSRQINFIDLRFNLVSSFLSFWINPGCQCFIFDLWVNYLPYQLIEKTSMNLINYEFNQFNIS